MAVTVQFTSTDKRRNSTEIPVSFSQSYAMNLKEGSSIVRPVFSVQWQPSTPVDPPLFNYCHVSEWNRYYWIDNWEYRDRQWLAYCSPDPMASFKTDIGNARKYVLRSSHTYNSFAIDNKYPALMPPTTEKYPISLQHWIASDVNPYSTGNFVVGIVSRGGSNSGGIKYYFMTVGDFGKLIDDCFQHNVAQWVGMGNTTDFGQALKEFGSNITKTVNDPFQYVNSVKWFPNAFSGTQSASARLGWMEITGLTNTYVMDNPIVRSNTTITVPAHSPITEPYLWQQIEPYYNYKLVIPPFGAFTLDARELTNAGGIDISILIDGISGIASMQVRPKDGDKVLVMASGQVGVPIEIGGVQTNYSAAMGTIASLVSAAAAVGSGGSSLAATAAAVGGIASAAGQGWYDVVTSGGSGGVGAVMDEKALYETHYPHAQICPDEFGYPLAQEKVLNTIPGFILCADKEIKLSGATPEEYAEVEDNLVGGFYYE